jgi:hypothetical protein
MAAHCIQPHGVVPFSFVTCLSRREVFEANLLASPTMGSGTVHELVAVANCPSAADGLNVGLKRAKHEWVGWVHEDVLLPEGRDRCLANRLEPVPSGRPDPVKVPPDVIGNFRNKP